MCFRPTALAKREVKCTKCGTVAVPGSKVCAGCGEELPKGPMPPGISAPPVPPRPKAPVPPAAPNVPPAAPRKPEE